MNKTLVRTSILSVLFLFFGLATQAADVDLDFKLVNKTGYDIKNIFISPSKTDEWGENVLQGGLKDGQTASITFNPKATATKWDLKIVWDDSDDAPVEWHDCKLSEISKITLRYNKEKDESFAEVE